MLQGSFPAVVTPFKDDRIDVDTLVRLVDWHVGEGSSGIVVAGTTGECSTLSHAEHLAVVEVVVKQVGGRLPVIAGAGSNSTREAIELTLGCEKLGVAAVLHVTGYYNKPSQRQIVNHFKEIHAASSVPIILYDIPSRTGLEFTLETIAELGALDRVIGIKDSTGDMSRVVQQTALVKKPFSFLSGDDSSALSYVAQGGMGCISVTANVAPQAMARMLSLAGQGDLATALKVQRSLMPLHKALFLEPSPAGIKYAMFRKGLCAEDLRLPLTPVSRETRRAIDHALELVEHSALYSSVRN